jgi:hypothetical protein
MGVNEVEGGQSRIRTRRRGLLLALVGLVVLAAAVLGGVVLDRTVLETGSGITEAQHDRLIHQCEVGERRRYEDTRAPEACTPYVDALVAWDEHEAMSYRELSAEVNASLEDAIECDDEGGDEDDFREYTDRLRARRRLADLADLERLAALTGSAAALAASSDCELRHGERVTRPADSRQSHTSRAFLDGRVAGAVSQRQPHQISLNLCAGVRSLRPVRRRASARRP